MTNMRVAMLLEVATTAGALSGAYLSGVISTNVLYIIFGVVLGYSAIVMYKNRHTADRLPTAPDALADRLNLHGDFYDESQKQQVSYKVTGTKYGFGLMYLVGVVSGLRGIGSGVLKVPAMDLVMLLPIKVSTATSNFMIGVTAAASARVYFARGDIDPFIAAPVMAGVLIGATIGSKLLGRLENKVLRSAFVIVLFWVSCQMLWKGLHG